MEESLERVCLELEVEKERVRQEIREEVTRQAEAEYLALDAFGIVRVDYFWEGWEEFKDVASEQFLNVDFSSIKPRGIEVEDEEGGEHC